jgi:hypothetical protein
MEQVPEPRRAVRESLDDQARRKGLRPVERVGDMARDGVFSSDEELEEFLAFVYATRHDDGA